MAPNDSGSGQVPGNSAESVQPVTQSSAGPLTRWSSRTLGWLENTLSSLGGLIMAGLLGLVCLDVVLRYGFGTGVKGSHGLIEGALMPALVFLPLAYTMREGAHPRIDLFYDMLSRSTQRVVDISTRLISLSFWIVAAYAVMDKTFADMGRYGGSVTTGIALPLHYGYAVVSLGIVAAVARSLWLLWAEIQGHAPRAAIIDAESGA